VRRVEEHIDIGADLKGADGEDIGSEGRACQYVVAH
jgi:hypothetical protein